MLRTLIFLTCVFTTCWSRHGRRGRHRGGPPSWVFFKPLDGVRRQGGGSPVAGAAFVPEVKYDGKWYPICGHYFWDNQNGATTVCAELGFPDGGEVVKTREMYAVDAMPVGTCAAGQSLDGCHQSGTAFWGNLGWRDGACKAGTRSGVKVKCTGASELPTPWVVQGRPGVTCVDPSCATQRIESHEKKYALRCCADTKLNDQFMQSGGGCRVWHNSFYGYVTGTGNHEGCMTGGISFDDAVYFCADMGARMCTKAEVEAGCVAGSGCGSDHLAVWAVQAGYDECLTTACDSSCAGHSGSSGCCQQYDCPHGCKMRSLGLGVNECIEACRSKHGSSGCFESVLGFSFNLCQANTACVNTPGMSHADACVRGCESYIPL